MLLLKIQYKIYSLLKTRKITLKEMRIQFFQIDYLYWLLLYRTIELQNNEYIII